MVACYVLAVRAALVDDVWRIGCLGLVIGCGGVRWSS